MSVLTYTYIRVYKPGRILILLRSLPTYICAPPSRPRERDSVLESANAVGKMGERLRRFSWISKTILGRFPLQWGVDDIAREIANAIPPFFLEILLLELQHRIIQYCMSLSALRLSAEQVICNESIHQFIKYISEFDPGGIEEIFTKCITYRNIFYQNRNFSQKKAELLLWYRLFFASICIIRYAEFIRGNISC